MVMVWDPLEVHALSLNYEVVELRTIGAVQLILSVEVYRSFDPSRVLDAVVLLLARHLLV